MCAQKGPESDLETLDVLTWSFDRTPSAMTDLSQAEFGRIARGGELSSGPRPAEDVVLGISSTSHAAIRRVHRESPAKARADLAGKLRRFFLAGGRAAETARRYQDCVEGYIAWDEAAEPATETPTKGRPVVFSNGVVRARPDVILGDEETGEYEVRALLWDELDLDQDSAELIALPLIERVEDSYGERKVDVVKVLHLVTNHLEEVDVGAARARRADVETLLASA